jgi:hypothetical protein
MTIDLHLFTAFVTSLPDMFLNLFCEHLTQHKHNIKENLSNLMYPIVKFFLKEQYKYVHV